MAKKDAKKGRGVSSATKHKEDLDKADGSLRFRLSTKAEQRRLDREDTVEDIDLKLKRKEDGHYEVDAPGSPLNRKQLRELTSKPIPFRTNVSRSWKSWILGRRFFFPMGIAIGAILCLVLMGDYTDLQNDFGEIWQSMPSNLDPRDMLSNLTLLDGARKAFENRDFTVGENLAQEHKLSKKHPIILIPGIISTGLESWGTEPPSRPFFRKRLWGTSTMIKAVMTDKDRWLQAMSVDPETGLDPKGFKIRAAQGVDAASEFIQGYWIWQKIVENLATLGYDSNSMDMAAYDWRLSYYNLEIRDAFFTRFKQMIERTRKHNGQKVVLCSHSMGGTVVLYFLKWVESQPDATGFGGGGGPQWVEENIESWVNVAGSLLGVSKAMATVLSGEMRDTVELHPAAAWVLEKFFSRRERAKLFRRWPGASSMWMKGGDRVWGDKNSAPDDPPNATDTHGRFLSFRHPGASPDAKDLDASTVSPNLTIDAASPYILTHSPAAFQRMIASNYSYGFEADPKKLAENDKDHRKWTNPLETRLPNAPSMKIFCLYGHGKDTERSYWYMQGEYEEDESNADATGPHAACDASDPSNMCDNSTLPRTPLDFPLARQQWIDAAVNVKGSVPEVRSGVKFADGDGTIPVLSLGAMCVKGWKGKTKWNPAGIEVVTQEYKHSPESLDLRGGPLTADHVDILGSSPLNEAILKIAGGRRDLVKQQIGSGIMEYVDKMDWD